MDDFWQRVVLAAISPLVAALVGTLGIGLVAARITERFQLRRQDRSLREQIIVEMTQTASGIHIETQHFWRATKIETMTPDRIAELRKAWMSTIYLLTSRVTRWRCAYGFTSRQTSPAFFGMPRETC